MKNAVGLVLCGGRSSRMGFPKAWLDLGGETLLARAVRTLGACTDRVIVCGAPGQPLPSIPAGAIRLDDVEPGCGPLRALAAALREVDRQGWRRALALAVDVPLFSPAMGELLLDAFRPSDLAVVPWSEGFVQPLAAAYRTTVAMKIDFLIDSGIDSMRAFISRIPHRELSAGDYAHLDPTGRMLRNINTPEEFQALVGGSDLCPPRRTEDRPDA